MEEEVNSTTKIKLNFFEVNYSLNYKKILTNIINIFNK